LEYRMFQFEYCSYSWLYANNQSSYNNQITWYT
jgi:hypothetical protein